MPPLSVTSTAVAIDPVTAGKAAWGRIQTASKMMREDWRLVGEALLVGRRLHTSDKLFGGWCRENGFGDMDRRRRVDAMWLAQNWSTVQNLDSSYNSPSDIRTAYNAALAGTVEADDEEADTDTTPAALPSPPTPEVQAIQAAQAPPPKPTTSATPPWDDEEEAEVEAEVDAEPASKPVDIFSRQPSAEDNLRMRAGRLIGIPLDAAKSASLVDFDTYLGSIHPQSITLIGRDALVERLVAGGTPKEAIAAGMEAMRRKEEDLIEQFTAFVQQLRGDGAALFLTSVRKNPLLNGDNRKVTALAAHAFSHDGNPTERETAISALERMQRDK